MTLTLFLDALRRLFADEAVPLAGNIAFRTLFSLFPFLIFLTALAGFFGSEALAEQVINYLLSVSPVQLAQPLAPEIRSILTVPRADLLSVSALLTIWSAMGGVDSLRVGLNRAYDLRDERHFGWIYFKCVIFVVGAAALLMAVAALIVVSPVVLAFISAHAPELRPSFHMLDRMRYPLAILLLTGGLLLCHRYLPAKPLRFTELLPGVVLTVAVWIGMSLVFSTWLVNFSTFASTYASLSGLFAAMFFLYLAALALIFGGEVNRVLALRRIGKSSKSAQASKIGNERI